MTMLLLSASELPLVPLLIHHPHHPSAYSPEPPLRQAQDQPNKRTRCPWTSSLRLNQLLCR